MVELVNEVVIMVEKRLAEAKIELIKDVVHIVVDAQEERVNGIG